MKVPFPRPPCKIFSVDPPNGMMLRRLFVLRAAVKAAFQLSPFRPPSSIRALRLSSIPLFRMLPMLVVTKFDRLLKPATGTEKRRSSVSLRYQSIAPLKR